MTYVLSDSSNNVQAVTYDAIRYQTIGEFNVHSKAECDQLKLAHVARKNIKRRH